jgi:CheY-like chemotaxis protein
VVQTIIRVPCVLVVEDEILIAEMVRETLIDYGYSVHAVGNAAEALAYLSNNNAVDVMFTDINLPGPVDGATLAQKARAMQPSLPVVFASGRWALLEKLRDFPNSVVLHKPYSLTRACEAVATLLHSAGSVASAGARG